MDKDVQNKHVYFCRFDLYISNINNIDNMKHEGKSEDQPLGKIVKNSFFQNATFYMCVFAV